MVKFQTFKHVFQTFEHFPNMTTFNWNLTYNNYYDLHVIIRGVNKQNLGVYKSFISLRPKAEVK